MTKTEQASIEEQYVQAKRTFLTEVQKGYHSLQNESAVSRETFCDVLSSLLKQ